MDDGLVNGLNILMRFDTVWQWRLSDLAQAMGIPPSEESFGGRLGLSEYADGKRSTLD
jgi:hypothetical protein